MPRLWILSDLHLEALPHPDRFQPEPQPFDVLVAAGDIWESRVDQAFRLLSRLAKGRPVIFVMGNHEYWRRSFHEELADARRLALLNGITLLEGDAADIEGMRFIGATLWADDELSGFAPRLNLATGEPIDIRDNGMLRAATFGDITARHRASRRRLARFLARPCDGRPVVVVTHHPPHPAGRPGLPPARPDASDLARLTDSGRADLWVHGHVHVSVDTVRPGGTRMLCNAAGLHFENRDFREDLVIELPATTRLKIE